jgi:hypothetical protein
VVRRLDLALVAICASALAAAGAAPAAAPPPGIRSPSGNISCAILPPPSPDLLCDIARADYVRQLQAGCIARASLDWHGFTLSVRGKGMVVCSGGILSPQRPRYVTLPYGRAWRHGGFTCSSRVTGITCRNGSGHGLFLSREAWRAW